MNDRHRREAEQDSAYRPLRRGALVLGNRERVKQVVIIRRGLTRRGFAAAAAVLAIGALLAVDGVKPQSAWLLSVPGTLFLAFALGWPYLWRASPGTRAAAIGYFGLPAGLALAAPLA